MNAICGLAALQPADAPRAGGKAMALWALAKGGFQIPHTVCVTTDAYDAYLNVTGLRPRILMELNRKAFGDMRWEEIWDASLRIRNMFQKKQMPEALRAELEPVLASEFGDAAVVVRSSAPGEDAAGASFAGLHESWVNIRGPASILESIRRVWASLWSDAALLYRKELGLEVEGSAMAVVVQQIIVGEASGVAFTRDPDDGQRGIIESVHGLNQGLVDGSVAPDRWFMDRRRRTILAHEPPAARDRYVAAAEDGVQHETLPEDRAARPPLSDDAAVEVFGMALAAETLFESPQDVEWTRKDGVFFFLQSRPITTMADSGEDGRRSWYLSLRKSFDSLKQLRQKIEGQLIPEMIASADAMAQVDFSGYSDARLADALEHRIAVHRHWVDVYWTDFIPFAHATRLFGQIYNDAVGPDDPYEFVDLLGTSELESLSRNRMLEDLAGKVRSDPSLRAALENHRFSGLDPAFTASAQAFFQQFRDPAAAYSENADGAALPDGFVSILLQMADHPESSGRKTSGDSREMAAAFLDRFAGEKRQQAEELLDLARASYRMRDDDNIYLGRIEHQMQRALDAGRLRLAARGQDHVESIAPEEVIKALRDPAYIPALLDADDAAPALEYRVKARQLVGQPAGRGLARGNARVIHSPADLSGFLRGEILVCDAVDPNMTFVVPLAAGIVERRGGMLIHGAIIAREYGIACVTGVADAAVQIKTGDFLTVDGYLGIVTIG